MGNAKFPPDDWSIDTKLDWLIDAFGNHMKSHTRALYALIALSGSLVLAIVGILSM
ncbi:MAG: hypothetical protein V3W37_08025 [Candidatus Binatia bacterium]